MIQNFTCFAQKYLQSLPLASGALHIVNSDNVIIASTSDDRLGETLDGEFRSIDRAALWVAPDVSWWLIMEGNCRDVHLVNAIKTSLETAFTSITPLYQRAPLCPEEVMVRDLLQEPPPLHDNSLLVASLKKAGFDVTQSRAVIIIDFEEKANRYFNVHLDLGYDASAEKAKEDIIKAIRTNPFITTQDIVAQYGPNQVVIVKVFMNIGQREKYYVALDRICGTIFNELESRRIFSVRAAYGNVYNDIYHVRRSYQEAQVLIHLGTAYLGRNGLYKMEDLLVEYMSYSLPSRYVDKIIDPLLAKLKGKGESDDQDLLHIMETYVDTGLSLKQTAQKLYLHRNTIAGKVERYQDITGLNPSENFNDALLTKLLAVQFRLRAAAER